MSTTLRVICLCAEWCGACREFRPAFDALGDDHANLRFRWLDIEDEPELVGELDITTFPTLVLARGARVLFGGPVLPQPAVFKRMMAAALAGDSHAAMNDDLKAQFEFVVQAVAARENSGST